jgi:hypothetical protein
MVLKREVSPTSRAQVSAVMGPTPGMVLNRLSLSASSGSRSSDRSRVVSSLIDRSICSRQSLSSGRILSLTSSLVASSSARSYWSRNEEDPGFLFCRAAYNIFGRACVCEPPPETPQIPQRSPDHSGISTLATLPLRQATRGSWAPYWQMEQAPTPETRSNLGVPG